MRCSLLLMSLALLPPEAAGDVSQELCLDVADQASLISLRVAASPETNAETLNATVGLGDYQQTLYKVQLREWGSAPDPEADKQAAKVGLGDGRWLTFDPVDAEELFEDAVEEKALTAEMKQFAEIRDRAIQNGMMYFDLVPTLPPLQPRVRGIDGCLLDGPPKSTALAPGVSGVVVINMDTRPDRWEFVQNSSGLWTLGDVKRLSAVRLRNWEDVKKLNGTRREVALDKVNHTNEALVLARDSSLPEDNARYFAKLSCYMSHLEAITTLARLADQAHTSGQVYLVMEDDHMITRDLAGLIPYISHAVGSSWDAIRLDCWLSGDAAVERDNRLVFRTRDSETMGLNYGGSQAVLYRSETLWKVAAYWRGEPFREADSMFWTDKISTYCVNWNITKRARQFGSNVNNVSSFRRFSRHIHAEEMDPYEEYISAAKLENPEHKASLLSEEQIQTQREEHAKHCMKQRANRRIHSQKLINPMRAQSA